MQSNRTDLPLILHSGRCILSKRCLVNYICITGVVLSDCVLDLIIWKCDNTPFKKVLSFVVKIFNLGLGLFKTFNINVSKELHLVKAAQIYIFRLTICNVKKTVQL